MATTTSLSPGLASSTSSSVAPAPHILMVVPRGEALRNFFYSGALATLGSEARVSVLSVVDDERLIGPYRAYAERMLTLPEFAESTPLRYLRAFANLAHYRFIDTEVGRMQVLRHVEEVSNPFRRLRRQAERAASALFAQPRGLHLLTAVHEKISWHTRPTNLFAELIGRLRPDLVFNTSHIHGPAADEPMRAARNLGVPTATFLFSWDNLTSRGRILTPYDYYLVWNDTMREELWRFYRIASSHVFITGTPQFDLHVRGDAPLSREQLCRAIGADPHRPLILYTTGMHTHFPEEYRTVEAVIQALKELPFSGPRPQLIVRCYIKGTSEEMLAIARRDDPDVVFPRVLWEPKWLTPLPEDQPVYSSLLHHCSLGINAASTVSLELIMHDKPVINLGFDPPGSRLGRWQHFERHLGLDHYKPVVDSGAVMVARSVEDLRVHLQSGLANPGALSQQRKWFLRSFFGNTLDGRSAERIAGALLHIVSSSREARL